MDNKTNINYELLKSLIQQFLNENVVDGSFVVSETGEIKQLPKKNLNEICFNFLYRIISAKRSDIGSRHFKNVYSEYTTIIKLLQEMNMIEVTKTYSIYKHESMKYKIINNTILLTKKVDICDELKKYKEYIKNKKNRKFLKYNNTTNIKININKNDVLNILKEKYTDKSPKENYQNIQKQLKAYHKIQNNEVTGGFAADGRLYSSFTNITKDIRKLVYHNPETNKIEGMVEFDIHATHPFLLPNVLTTMLKNSEENPKHKTNDHIHSQIRKEITTYTLLLERCSEQSLNFYEELGKLSGNKVDKELIKKSLLSYLNNEKQNVRFPLIDDIFKVAFPFIRTFIINKKRGGYNTIYTELTKAETSLIMPMCEEIVSKGLALISIHDCLMFRQSQSEQIMEIITRHMQEKECALLIWKEKESISAPPTVESEDLGYNDKENETPSTPSTPSTKDFPPQYSISVVSLSCGGKSKNDPIPARVEGVSSRVEGVSSRVEGVGRTIRQQIRIVEKGNGYRCQFTKDGKRVDILSETRKNETKEQFKDRLKSEYGLTDNDFKE